MTRGPRKPKRLRREPRLESQPPRKLSFSFQYLDIYNNPKFRLADAPNGYLVAIFDRLKALSGLTERELKADRSKSLRSHPINFNETTEPEGFSHLNKQLRLHTPYQVTVSSNEHGRIHGFFQADTFCVVWLDHAHRLYT